MTDKELAEKEYPYPAEEVFGDYEFELADAQRAAFIKGLNWRGGEGLAKEKGVVWLKEFIDIRNKLYNDLPTGEINAFELLQIVKWHINDLDNLASRIDKYKPGVDLVKLQAKFDKFFAEETEETFNAWLQSKGLQYAGKEDGKENTKMWFKAATEEIESLIDQGERNVTEKNINDGLKLAIGVLKLYTIQLDKSSPTYNPKQERGD